MINMLQSFLYLLRPGVVDWNYRFWVEFLQTAKYNYTPNVWSKKWRNDKIENTTLKNNKINTMPDTWHIWASSLQKLRATLSCTLREKLIQAHRLTVIPLIIFCITKRAGNQKISSRNHIRKGRHYECSAWKYIGGNYAIKTFTHSGLDSRW